MRVVKLKLALLSIMAGAVITTGMVNWVNTPVKAAAFQVDAVKTEYLRQPIIVNGGDTKVLMKLRDIALKDLLKLLSNKAGFNILLDESVEGDISVDLNNVTINQALETIKDYADLVYMQDDKTLIVANKDSQLAKSINQQVSQMIPVKYVNAKLVAEILNSTIFSDSGAAGSNTNKKASAEYRTNSVVIVGTNNDVRLAEDLIKNVDVPRQSKTFKINHANVVDVAQLLQATVFNDGIAPFDATTAGAAGDLPSNPTAISVTTESFEEGAGSATEVQGAAAQAGGGTQQTFTLRKTVLEDKEIKISPNGPLIVPDSRGSTLTIMGTVEQIALAEAIIPTLDQKLPQVAIEASLLEVNEGDLRQLSSTWGQSAGQWTSNFNNDYNSNVRTRAADLVPVNIVGFPTLKDEKPINGNGSALTFSTNPINRSLDFLFQLNMLLSKNKAKLLANPTILAVHNTEAIISITEEIVRRTTVTRDATGFMQTQVEIGEAGIILNILPKVSADGFVSLRIRPSVSTIASEFRDNQNNITTLLKRKDFAVQEVRVSNGQTLALGGLIQEASRKDMSRIPGLGDLPLVGVLFRTNERDQLRSELIMLVTPRIINDDKPIISSSFDEKPIVEIPTNISSKAKKTTKVPVPSSVQTEKEGSQVIDVTSDAKERNKTQKIDISKVKYEVKPVKTENRVNAYTIDSVMKELGINNIKINSDKNYDKKQIDDLLNEYLPKGSK